MKKSFFMGLLIFLIGCPPPTTSQTPTSSTASVPAPQIDYIAQLNSATVIEVKEYALSMGKDYDIHADGIKVATVSGKDFRLLGGDVFTLTALDGTLLASEEEQKRFLLQFNRSAVVYDSEKTIKGYIAEDRISNLFSFNYVFYFYDAEQNVIGKSEKFSNSSLGAHKIYNQDNTEAYDVDKHFTLIGGDSYTITVTDPNSPIDRYSAILLVCIEDAIADAIAAKKKKKK